MIDANVLVGSCQKLVTTLEADLQGRVDNESDIRDRFNEEWRTRMGRERLG